MSGKSNVVGESAPPHRDKMTYRSVQYRQPMAGRYVLMACRAIYVMTTDLYAL